MNISKTLTSTFFSIAFATAIGAATYETAYAAVNAGVSTAVSTSANATPTAEQFQIGSMYVEKYANPQAKGAPVILIPGLSSGGYVWDETVKQLRAEHELYVITLAGFNGKPALPGAKLPKAKDSLLELIQTQKINQPILVGHSLGSALSIWFAESHSNLIRGVFAVDGLPVFPGTQNMTLEQRTAMAEAGRRQMASADAKTFSEQQLQYMRMIGLVDQAQAEKIAVRSATSDPVATADYMAELLMMDTRQDLPKISVPVALVSPYYATDFARMNMSEEAKSAYYMSFVQGIPKLNLVSIKDARHFVMLDQPTIFHEKLLSFINQL